MDKFPVLLSIPHGGRKIPNEIANRVCITPKDQFEDGDAFTREIYGIRHKVQGYVEGNIARAFVDLNRDVNDRPPKNPDGVVKSMTCLGKPIYHSDRGLDEELIDLLLRNYYHPYHKKIRELLYSSGEIKLMLDCHTMEAVGPEISPDPGHERPKFCLGSNYGKSCPTDIVRRMAHCFKIAFGLQDGEVAVDKPFAGGFITRAYGNNPTPCLQIEMNRNFYLANLWFDEEELTVAPARLEQLRQNFVNALDLFFSGDKIE